MAILTTKKRKSLKPKTFGLPGERKYPMPDKSHAGNAKARAQQQYNKGKLSKGELSKIDAKANKILGEGKMKHNPGYSHEGKSTRRDEKGSDKKPSAARHSRESGTVQLISGRASKRAARAPGYSVTAPRAGSHSR